MMERPEATVGQKIEWFARIWRQADRDAIADKDNAQKQQAEYWARQELRKIIDDAGRRWR
jgi:hypothetical protein